MRRYDLRKRYAYIVKSFIAGDSSVRQVVQQRRKFMAALTMAMLGAAMLCLGPAAVAQNAQPAPSADTFKARLSPVPIDVSMQSTIAGVGSITAKLSGNQLTISGTFEGLRSPATTAQIHRSPKGIPGPAILDITVTKSVKGAVSGSLELTPDQITDLRNGRWYVQIQSERAPNGNLWGWFLQQQ
jgi:hypothetical protein